jgi:hypothetical protein
MTEVKYYPLVPFFNKNHKKNPTHHPSVIGYSSVENFAKKNKKNGRLTDYS